MPEHEYPIDVTCPATGEPCELLVKFADQYTQDHTNPTTTEAKMQDDIATLKRILLGYSALRTCKKPQQT